MLTFVDVSSQFTDHRCSLCSADMDKQDLIKDVCKSVSHFSVKKLSTENFHEYLGPIKWNTINSSEAILRYNGIMVFWDNVAIINESNMFILENIVIIICFLMAMSSVNNAKSDILSFPLIFALKS